MKLTINQPSVMDPVDVSTRMTSFDHLHGKSVLQHNQSHAVDDSSQMRGVCFRRMETACVFFYPEYHGEMHDSRSMLLIAVFYEIHAELKHEVIEFIIIDVRVLRRVFYLLQQLQFFIEKFMSMHVQVIHGSQRVANQSLPLLCVFIMSIVGIVDPESYLVWDCVDESVDPIEDQCLRIF